MTRWLDPQPINSSSLDSLGLYPLVAQTLVRRGIADVDSARAFLQPDLLPSTPFPGIQKVVDRIVLAMRSGEPVCVWGDFDVDGQTATTVLVQALQTLGANVTYHIPIRATEGHGVNIENLGPIIDRGARLILTCDTGISAHEAVDYAKSRGVDFVITDHHDLGETLPQASAVVNPKLLPEKHPLSNLAGVGVAYKLAEAMLDGEQWTVDSASRSAVNDLRSEDLFDLIALGLIADVALLRGETRSLAQKGIQALRNTQRLGIKVMAELSGTSLETLTEETIGFTFAPRLNALGRLSDANPAVELLITKDPARARLLATQIEGLNIQRRLLTDQVYQAAEAQLREDPDLLTEPMILLAHPNWPGGVVGIVANKLVEHYHKPTLLLVDSEDGILRGSARSVEGLHITQAISANKDLLLSFGGHPMAAGVSLRAENLAAFRKRLGKAIEGQLGETIREEATLQIDAWLALSEINLDLAAALESMSPFGAGNPPLILATRKAQLKSVAIVGKTKEHLRLTVEDEGGTKQNILWWNGAGEELPEEGSKFDVAYSLRASTYRGQKQLALHFEEFRPVEERPIEAKAPKLEVVDYRLKSTNVLTKTQEQAPALQIYCEGEDKKKVNGRDRNNLSPSEELAIYTAPPGPDELRTIFEQVKPRKIYLFAMQPPDEKADDFLTRLAGMAKFALNQRDGKVRASELAAALAQRAATVRLGLEWLAAGGHLVVAGDEDELHLATGNGIPNEYLRRELYVAVKGLLEETAAYRAHFAKADAETLFNF